MVGLLDATDKPNLT